MDLLDFKIGENSYQPTIRVACPDCKNIHYIEVEIEESIDAQLSYMHGKLPEKVCMECKARYFNIKC